MSDCTINLGLHPKQQLALDSEATEILYGGAAGGGKSHLMRVASIIWCAQIAGLQIYLFRRHSNDLEKNHLHGPTGYQMLLSPWTSSGLVEIVKGQIRFWNGSKIFLCHCKDEDDVYQYQGAEIHVLMIDELTHFTEQMYQFLRSRVRATGLDLTEFKGQFPKIFAGSNPGNIGHEWVKRYWIDDKEPMRVYQMPKEDGGKKRQFVSALLEDNPTLMEEDPDYEYTLLGLGSPQLVEAMRYGNWNIQAGSYYPEFGQVHIIQPFGIPDWWTRFRSFDWGSAKPFHVGWYAISDGTLPQYPKDAIIMYREWYGCKGPDEGLRMTVEEVAEGIKGKDGTDKIRYSVADTAIFTSDGGPSMAERFALKGVHWQPADKKRLQGWDQLRQRLKLNDDGKPMFFVFNTCRDTTRTIPLMISDEKNPEDIDTRLEDHACDSIRYAVMSRPFLTHKPKKLQPLKDFTQLSIDELWKIHDNNYQHD